MQDFVREQHLQSLDHLQQISTDVRTLLRESSLSHHHQNVGSKQHQADLKDLADGLSKVAQDVEMRKTAMQHKDQDPFSFSATIIRAHSEDFYNAVARGKLDTGCDENWISMELLERVGIGDQIQTMDSIPSYVAFGGHELEPIGVIDVTWFATNAAKSRKTTFLVHNEVPFDMVLGRQWIAEESIFVFNRPALALRMGEFTREKAKEKEPNVKQMEEKALTGFAEEHRVIEENARAKGATNTQLSAIRRSEEATARDRLRQEKASRTTTAVTSMINSPASRSMMSLPATGQTSSSDVNFLGQRTSSASQTHTAD
ncbi:hypothetical protein ACLMJK_003127 [Lecanora helva]